MTDIKKRAKDETKSLIIAILAALFIRTFLFQPFVIPSGSMYPTLMVGDFLFVSKFSYGYSYTSFPFHPQFFKGRVMGHAPKRGDVVIFNNVNKPDMDYVKRCIGLPGDRIQVQAGIVHINGEPVKLDYVGMYTYVNYMGRLEAVKKYKETLPDGSSHFILKTLPFGEWTLDDTPEYTVPEGHFFMMGDNRDASSDSRVMDDVGFVHFDTIIGKAQMLFFSTDARLFRHPDSPWYAFWDLNILEWIPGIRWGRFLNMIR